MSPREVFALRDYLGPDIAGRTISDARQVVSLTNSVGRTCLGGRLGELSGRSVLLAVSDQLISAIAMTEIDGVARRMLLCPPDLNADHIQSPDGGCRDRCRGDRPSGAVGRHRRRAGGRGAAAGRRRCAGARPSARPTG